MTDSPSSPPRRPKGHQPLFFADPAIDQLHSAFLILATELAVAFDRIDTLERLAERQGIVRADIDGFVPDAEAQLQRAARRADIAERLLKPFRDYRDDLFERAAHSAGKESRELP